MHPIELCPADYKDSEGCKKIFCEYRNKKGKCSLDIEIEDRPYDVQEIADILQISRQRIWRLYDSGVSKMKNLVTRYY